MNTASRALQVFLHDTRHARAARLGGGVLAAALLGGVVWLAALAAAVGALPALFIRHISPRLEDIMLGFGDGVMAAASCFSLIIPGFAAGAMIWVVSHEIIPETHRKGHEQAATLWALSADSWS